jgi:hypothetical protein
MYIEIFFHITRHDEEAQKITNTRLNPNLLAILPAGNLPTLQDTQVLFLSHFFLFKICFFSYSSYLFFLFFFFFFFFFIEDSSSTSMP